MRSDFASKLLEADQEAQMFYQYLAEVSDIRALEDDEEIVSKYAEALDLTKKGSEEEREVYFHLSDFYYMKAVHVIPEIKKEMIKNKRPFTAKEIEVITKEITSVLDSLIDLNDKNKMAYMNKKNDLVSKFNEELSKQNVEVKKEGCYIATAVYGSYECPEVLILRQYRDNYLAKKVLGEVVIRIYYACSPILIKWFGKTKGFNLFWKTILNMFIKKLKASGYNCASNED